MQSSHTSRFDTLRALLRTANGANMENPPAKRALAVLDQPPPAEPVKPLRITDKVRRAIDLMVSGNCKKICDALIKSGSPTKLFPAP